MLLPVRGDVPTRARPLAVGILVAVNLLVFFYEISLSAESAGELAEFVESWGLVPREFLRRVGDGDPGVWLTPVTALFIHGGLPHLAGNLLYLGLFGSRIEDLVGRGRFLIFYFACGIAAAMIQVASSPASYTPTIGASGAISGVLGAYAISYPTGRLRLLWPPIRIPAGVFLLFWIAIQIVSGVSDWGNETASVAWWAHVGGFITGVALGRAMWVRKPTQSRLRI